MDVSSQQLSIPHPEEEAAGHVPFPRDAKDVPVPAPEVDRGLAPLQRTQASEDVTESRGPLVVQGFRRILHLPPHIALESPGMPGEDLENLLDHRPILVLRLLSDARARHRSMKKSRQGLSGASRGRS